MILPSKNQMINYQKLKSTVHFKDLKCQKPKRDLFRNIVYGRRTGIFQDQQQCLLNVNLSAGNSLQSSRWSLKAIFNFIQSPMHPLVIHKIQVKKLKQGTYKRRSTKTRLFWVHNRIHLKIIRGGKKKHLSSKFFFNINTSSRELRKDDALCPLWKTSRYISAGWGMNLFFVFSRVDPLKELRWCTTKSSIFPTTKELICKNQTTVYHKMVKIKPVLWLLDEYLSI